MIKKALIFAILIVGGFFALNSMIEGDSSVDPAPVTTPATQPEQGGAKSQAGVTPAAVKPKPAGRPQGPGIRINAGAKRSAIRTDYRGEWNFAGFREIQLPSGDLSRVKDYQVRAKDSETETDNRLLLKGVTVDFFTLDNSDKNRPRSIKTGTMSADRARLAFSQGADEMIRPAEDKQMEFWGVTYTSTATRSMRQLTIKVGEAHVLNTANRVRLWTPSKLEPVEIIASGKRGFRVTGKGLDAWIPSNRDAKGGLSAADSANRNIFIFHDPLLTQLETTMSSKGQLHIEENAALASALVTMTEKVRVESLRKTQGTERDPKKSAGKVIAEGDFLRANFSRSTASGGDSTTWTRIHLTGAPARLKDDEQVHLTSASITVLPDSEGQPYWFTASGSDTINPEMRFSQNGLTHHFKSAGQVHVIRVRKQHDLLARSYGIPLGTIPAQFEQVLIFEGKTEVSSPSEGLTLLATKGITVIRSESPELRDSFLMRGRGDVDISATPPTPTGKPVSKARGNLHAIGNGGFTLRQGFAPRSGNDNSRAPITRSIRLGAATPNPAHHYDVRHDTTGGKTEKLRVFGSGRCAIQMRGVLLQQLDLASPNHDIEVEMTGKERASRLSQARSVMAWFQADNQLGRFVSKGKECRLAFKTQRGLVQGVAQEIRQSEPGVYQLHGQLAELREPRHGTLRGKSIFVRQLSEEDLQLRATPNAYLQFTEVKPGKGPGSTTVGTLHANEIRVEPFLIDPVTAKIYGDLLPESPAMGSDFRFLFATGKVQLELRTRGEGANPNTYIKGLGDSLRLRTDKNGKVFSDGNITGTPARFDTLDAASRRTVARSDLIRFFLREGEQFLTLDRTGKRKPSVEWIGDLRSTSSGGAPVKPNEPQPTTLLTCEGPIVVGPKKILCQGAVRARGYDVHGEPDPNGLSLDTKNMVIDRTSQGLVDKIRADTDVVFQWSGTRGTCDSLTIDLTGETMRAKGSTKPALIQLPNAKLTAQQVNYNYRTKMSACWRGNFKQLPTAK
jgi:hypothetical protein